MKTNIFVVTKNGYNAASCPLSNDLSLLMCSFCVKPLQFTVSLNLDDANMLVSYYYTHFTGENCLKVVMIFAKDTQLNKR